MYDEIVKKYYKLIRNYCRYKLNGNMAAAEDVTQEVFFALAKKIDRLKMSENIRFWLYRAADFEIRNYIRKNPAYMPLDELTDFPTEDVYSLDDPFECLSGEEKTLLNEYYCARDREAVARSYHISMNTLYVRIHRIRNKLAKNLCIDNKSES